MMRINNNSYTDALMRDDVILRYSRTMQALNAEMPRRFDSVLSKALAERTVNTGRDTLLTETAQRYSQARDISGRYDAVLTAYTQNLTPRLLSRTSPPAPLLTQERGEISTFTGKHGDITCG